MKLVTDGAWRHLCFSCTFVIKLPKMTIFREYRDEENGWFWFENDVKFLWPDYQWVLVVPTMKGHKRGL